MPARKITILTADDDPQLLRLVARNLQFEGYEVITASDGQQALEEIESHTLDLALLDVMMVLRFASVCVSSQLFRLSLSPPVDRTRTKCAALIWVLMTI